jgi:hypothetical protein
VSKLVGVRSMAQIDGSQMLLRNNERLPSPININNYINIYTHKGASMPMNYVSPQPKKALSYGNASF